MLTTPQEIGGMTLQRLYVDFALILSLSTLAYATLLHL
jgi:hypothetical protein